EVAVQQDHPDQQERQQDRRAEEVAAPPQLTEGAEHAEREQDRHRAVVLQEGDVLAPEGLEQRRQRRGVLANGLYHERIRQEVRAVRDRDRAEHRHGQQRGEADRQRPPDLPAREEREAHEADQEESLVAGGGEERGRGAQGDRAAALERWRHGGAGERQDRKRRERDRQEQMEDVLHPEQHHPRQRKRDDDGQERRGPGERLCAEAGERRVGDRQGQDGEGAVG